MILRIVLLILLWSGGVEATHAKHPDRYNHPHWQCFGLGGVVIGGVGVGASKVVPDTELYYAVFMFGLIAGLLTTDYCNDLFTPDDPHFPRQQSKDGYIEGKSTIPEEPLKAQKELEKPLSTLPLWRIYWRF